MSTRQTTTETNGTNLSHKRPGTATLSEAVSLHLRGRAGVGAIQTRLCFTSAPILSFPLDGEGTHIDVFHGKYLGWLAQVSAIDHRNQLPALHHRIDHAHPKHGIAIQSVGGVILADTQGEFSKVSYRADITGGDLYPEFPEG